MKTKQLFLLLVIGLISVFYIGCGSNKQLSQTNEGNIPDWFLNVPQDPNYIFQPSTATSQDMQLAIDKATQDARAEVARTVQVKMEGLQKKFDEEVGVKDNSTLLQQFTQATKSVVSESLNGSQVKQKQISKDGQVWRAYVLVQYPIGAASDAFLKQIKNNNEMYTRFRASQTFKELNDEVQKYEDWKAKQQMH